MKPESRKLAPTIAIIFIALWTLAQGCSSDSGQPVAPRKLFKCSISATDTLRFGSIEVGQSSSMHNFTVKNTGTGTLSGSVSENCGDFEIVSGGGSYALAAGDSVVVQIRFSPQSTGPKTCTIDTGTPCSIDVSCTGAGTPQTPSCAVSPTAPLSFGDVTVGQSSLVQSFTITNTGGGTLTGSVSGELSRLRNHVRERRE